MAIQSNKVSTPALHHPNVDKYGLLIQTLEIFPKSPQFPSLAHIKDFKRLKNTHSHRGRLIWIDIGLLIAHKVKVKLIVLALLMIMIQTRFPDSGKVKSIKLINSQTIHSLLHNWL